MTDVPFCERCGRPGPTMSGMHPSDGGLVRWTLYRCGHLISDVEPDDATTDTETPELSPA